jgi:RNA polymerase sporulation-specific sigma factor
MQGKVEIAGVNTAKLKVLKNDETMALLRRVKEGDQEARQQLIEGNLRLVLSVIQRFASRERRRPVSGGLRGTYQGHRQL